MEKCSSIQARYSGWERQVGAKERMTGSYSSPKNGTATKEQKEMLDNGHWKPKKLYILEILRG